MLRLGRNEFDMWNMCGDHREADYVICNTGGKILRAADDAVLSLHLADAESVRALAGACLGHNDCVLYVIAAGYMGVSRMTPASGNTPTASAAARRSTPRRRSCRWRACRS